MAEDPDGRLLAQRAVAGDADAQREVNHLAAPLIEFQNDRFCKRFCRDQRFRYRCTLPRPLGGAPADAAWCEWGNAGYGWMLDQLCGAARLERFQGSGKLFDYLYTIANSRPFYERWKDWRFGRRDRVPEAVAALGDGAAAVYFGLRAGRGFEQIAQDSGVDRAEVERLADAIVLNLTRRGRLHLLDPPREESLTTAGGDESPHQRDVAAEDLAPEHDAARTQLSGAFSRLDAVEQFVLEAMVVDDQPADDVLAALRSLDLSIKPGVAAADTDRQQLYYFKRKALARLAEELTGE